VMLQLRLRLTLPPTSFGPVELRHNV
jgi:hypothetical protein